MNDFSPCPDREQLQGEILGLLSQAEAEQIEQHILQCQTCVGTLAGLESGDTLLEAMRAVPRISLELAGYRQQVSVAVGRWQASRRLGVDASSQRSSAEVPIPVAGPPGRLPEAEGEIESLDFLAPPEAPGELGRLGPYRVLRLLGAGGMGLVFEAEDSHLMRRVALKAMKPLLAASASSRRRFLREAQAAAAVEHDHIVPIYQVGEDRGIPFMAMPLLRGETLAARIERAGLALPPEEGQGAGKKPVGGCTSPQPIRKREGRALALDEVIRLGREVAIGLDAAHRAGLIHRDTKPGNIWLEAGTGRVKILDFGLARAAGAEEHLTQLGDLLGTPCYMSPEQAHGDEVDSRCDLFSLGCVLYHMATGIRPFQARDAVSTLLAVTTQIPRPARELNPRIPDDLNDLIGALLSKNPSDRPQTALEVAERLLVIGDALQNEGSESRIENPKFSPPPRRRGLIGVAAAAAAAMLLAGLVIVIKDRQGNIVATVQTENQADVKLSSDYTAEVRSSDDNDDRSKEEQAAATSPPRRPPQALAEPDGWPADAPPPAIAPFDKGQAQKHQQAWADFLKLPLECTNSIGMKFVLIPPGEFMMGTPAADIEETLKRGNSDPERVEHVKSQGPAHKVVLTQPFYLARHEVTQREYQAVMGKNPSHLAGIDTARHPVEGVSWNDAAEFCAKLSRQEHLQPFYFRSGETVTPLKGTGYRLPTEAEWEFASRAGTTTRYWVGNKDDELMAAGWCQINSGGRTHDVEELLCNPLRVFDIHGNVWEWVEDSWGPTNYAEFTETPAVNPVFRAGSRRVMRGGDWNSYTGNCQCSNRDKNEPTVRHHGIGFRVALVAVVSPADR